MDDLIARAHGALGLGKTTGADGGLKNPHNIYVIAKELATALSTSLAEVEELRAVVNDAHLLRKPTSNPRAYQDMLNRVHAENEWELLKDRVVNAEVREAKLVEALEPFNISRDPFPDEDFQVILVRYESSGETKVPGPKWSAFRGAAQALQQHAEGKGSFRSPPVLAPNAQPDTEPSAP